MSSEKLHSDNVPTPTVPPEPTNGTTKKKAAPGALWKAEETHVLPKNNLTLVHEREFVAQ
jgi:hypothetical protein